MFTPFQIKTTVRPDTSAAQDAGTLPHGELDQLFNRIRVFEHSDTIFNNSSNPRPSSQVFLCLPNFLIMMHFLLFNAFRIGLNDKLFFINSPFSPIVVQCLSFHSLKTLVILTQCGIYFSTFFFVPALLTLSIKLYKTFSIK